MDVSQTGSLVLNKFTSITLWLMLELALIGADTQQILGASIALKILFGLELTWGVIICVILTIVILYVQGIGQKAFEYIFLFFLTVMGITFWINFLSCDMEQADIWPQ